MIRRRTLGLILGIAAGAAVIAAFAWLRWDPEEDIRDRLVIGFVAAAGALQAAGWTFKAFGVSGRLNVRSQQRIAWRRCLRSRVWELSIASFALAFAALVAPRGSDLESARAAPGAVLLALLGIAAAARTLWRVVSPAEMAGISGVALFAPGLESGLAWETIWRVEARGLGDEAGVWIVFRADDAPDIRLDLAATGVTARQFIRQIHCLAPGVETAWASADNSAARRAALPTWRL